VPPVVTLESLTMSSPVDSEVDQLARDLEMSVGDTLGVSLLEVCTWYFRDSDEGADSEISQDLVEERNYGNMITNYGRSGRYW
jgi:hypothetical protein